jgi:hypothetical protein
LRIPGVGREVTRRIEREFAKWARLTHLGSKLRLMDNAAVEAVAAVLEPADFYAADHGVIYGVVLALVRNTKPADVVTVFQHLQGQRKADDVGGLKYLNDLAMCVPNAANTRRYAEIVKACAVRRRLVAVGRLGVDRERVVLVSFGGLGMAIAPCSVRSMSASGTSALPL